MIEEFRALALHQKFKDILKRDMDIKEVHNLVKLHCDERANDEMVLAQLITAKHFEKVR